MAQKTVIDELIVTLGLDPKNFKKGEKEAAAALVDLKNQSNETNKKVQEGAEKSGSALAALGKRVAVVALIFKGLKFATQNILDMSRATYDLANASRLLGEAPRMLRNFENVGEMFGGTADAVRKSVQGIKQAVHDLAFNGQMSQQLVQLGRLGVQFQDGKTGRARDFKDIAMDTAGALQRNIASGTMSESDALMFASSAGFDDGLSRAMVGGSDALALALARQENRRQVSPGDIAAATANEQAITSAGQAKDTAFTAAQTGASGFITRAAGAVEGAFHGGATGDASVAWEAWTAAIEPVTTGLNNFADATRNATDALMGATRKAMAGTGRAGYERQIQDSARKHGLDPEILAGVINTESRFDPNAVSGAGAKGIAQLMPQYFPGAGVDPMIDIDTAAGELARLKQSFMKTGSSESAAMDSALMAYNAGERRLRTSKVFGDGTGSELSGETISYPGQVYEYAASREAAGGGSTTTVQIDAIHIQTAATDANGIAGSIADATQRKLTAAQADSGMR